MLLSTKSAHMKELVPRIEEEKTHYQTLLSLLDEILYKVVNKETAYELWLKLVITWFTCSILFLKKWLFGLHIKEDLSLKENLHIFMEFKDIDVKMEDKDLSMTIFASFFLDLEILLIL